MSTFNPLKNYYGDSKSEVTKAFRPMRSYMNTISLSDVRLTINGITDIQMRIDDFDISNVILGYDKEILGSESIGHPSYSLVNKNGLNFEPFTFSMEEDSIGNVLPYLLEKVSNLIATGGANTVDLDALPLSVNLNVPRSTTYTDSFSIPKIVIRMYDNSRDTKQFKHHLVRKITLYNCVILGVDIEDFSVTDTDTVKYQVTIHPKDVHIYGDNTPITKVSK